MTKQNYRKKVYVFGGIAAGAVMLAVFALWLYTGSITSAKAAVYKTLSLPAVFVNAHSIPLAEISHRYNIFRALPEAEKIRLQDAKKLIVDKLVTDKKLELLADARKVKVADRDVEGLYVQMAQNLTGGDQSKLESAINSYAAMRKEDFQQQVLRTALLERGLKTWYHGQKDFNKAMYDTADKITSAAQGGEDFAGLAAAYSRDNATALFQGDSGFVTLSDLNPEIIEALTQASPGQVITIPGADGLHILKFLGRNAGAENSPEQVRLQHIYLPGSGFDSWLDQEMKKFKMLDLTGRLFFE